MATQRLQDPILVENGREAPLTDLLKQLARDTNELFRQEVTLAKVEFRNTGVALAQDLVKVVVALVLAGLGGMALTAFLVLIVGDLLGSYILGAVIVGVLLLAIGGFMAKRGLDDLKRQSLKPEHTIQTLREDKDWAAREARELKQQVMS